MLQTYDAHVVFVLCSILFEDLKQFSMRYRQKDNFRSASNILHMFSQHRVFQHKKYLSNSD